MTAPDHAYTSYPPATAFTDHFGCDQLIQALARSNATDRDFAIEIDPREADVYTLRHLQSLDFNRMSPGVQDLDVRVQKVIDRIPPRELSENLIDDVHAQNAAQMDTWQGAIDSGQRASCRGVRLSSITACAAM